MVLSTHAVVGAGVALMMPQHPVLGFLAGFMSHFVLDSLPHWDYPLFSVMSDEEKPMDTDMNVFSKMFLLDLLKIFLDMMIGAVAIYLLFGNKHIPLVLFAGAAGGILPDVLQFAYFKFRKWPLTVLQRFHNWAHTENKLNHRHILGPTLQLIFVIVFLVCLNYFVLK